VQVFSHLVYSASDYLKRQGRDPEALARTVGLPVAATRSAGEEIALSHQIAFFDLAAETLGDPHFGLSVGQHRAQGTYGLVEFLVRSSSTMGEAFQRASRYFSVLNPSSVIRFEAKGAEVELTHAVPGAPGALGRHGNELTLASMTLISRELTGRDWSPLAVWFANQPGPDRARLESFFGTKQLGFDAPNNGFRFAASDLELELIRSDPALASFLELQAQEKARALPSADDLVGQVEEAIRRALPDGAPSLERLALRMDLSARTLQRRLEERGARFADLLERIRQELAQKYVAEHDRPVTEIAFLLGYSDVTTFLRAFKRWTGKTPSELRGR
jgi:AraC-like DNA-binding protein